MKRLTKTEFIEKAKNKHANKYNYENSIYTKSENKIMIYCNNCFTNFFQEAGMHLEGNGCPSCAKSGFNKNKNAILYYLKFNNKNIYKIGITNNSVQKRYSVPERNLFHILKIEKFECGVDAFEKEQFMLRKLKNFKYKGNDLLDSGNTELVTVNPLLYL